MSTLASDAALNSDQIANVVAEELQSLPFIDVHTHLFMPSLGKLGLWGIDELLTYHYLEAELFRSCSIPPSQYWTLNKQQQADLIWRTLFVENPPVSESCRGIIAVLHAFGLPTRSNDLSAAREFFREQELSSHINNVFRLAGIDEAVMTNDPLDPEEARAWESGVQPDPRFRAVIRLDRMLERWTDHAPVLQSQGYRVNADFSGQTITEIRRFLADWHRRMQPVYMACSLTDAFQFPDPATLRGRILAEAVIPSCREFDIPLSLMIGVRRQVNPAIRLAGDAAGKADLRALEHLCVQFPDNRFLTSVLSRENQHELCVYARKFSNLMPFGCWWFLNNPSVVEEITRERIEMLGATFIPQHSDARVLEQVIYKWRNTRRTMTPIFANTYQLLAQDGRPVTRGDIRHDLTRMFRANFEHFVHPQAASEHAQAV